MRIKINIKKCNPFHIPSELINMNLIEMKFYLALIEEQSFVFNYWINTDNNFFWLCVQGEGGGC